MSGGFARTAEWVDADEAGRSHVVSFVKAVSGVGTTTSAWLDYSSFPGNPAANYYASNPLEAAVVDARRGITVPSVSPAKQFIRNLKLMSLASAQNSTANGRQQVVLADLLLYYPFIDGDIVGVAQDMDNATPLPRYTSGKVIAVAQSACYSSGQFTFSYTNQDGVSGRTSQTHFTRVVNGNGQIVSASVPSAASYPLYLGLQAGDTGVRSIESCTLSSFANGLFALVIVHPLMTAYISQESRRQTSGSVESFGACDEFASVLHHRPARILDGAVLSFFAAGHAGSLATSFMCGLLETTWGE